jgi:quercetin dioxygenase-like cupin family protein
MRYPSVAYSAALVLGVTIAAAGMVTWAQAPGHAGQASIYTAGKLEWKDGPPSLPSGAKFVVLEGDPGAKGEYFAFRLSLPDGYQIPPHWHPVFERVTVISGTLHLGEGEKIDPKATRALPAGSYFTMPPNMRHFARTEGPTVLQLTSIGPWQINYVNPEDDPRKGRP